MIESPGGVHDPLMNDSIRMLAQADQGGFESLKRYYVLKAEEIRTFAQEKGIYLIQFILSDDKIKFGTAIQKAACRECMVHKNTCSSVWENGGMEAFRKGLANKRKSICYGITGEVVKRKLEDQQ